MSRQYVQIHETAYPNKSLDAALSASASQQLLIQSVAAVNGTGASADIGIFASVNDSQFKVIAKAASDTDVTATIQAGSAITILPTTNDYGFIVQASRRFNCIAFNVSQAETGSPTYTYAYWDGSTWQSFTPLSSTVYTGTNDAIVFAAPLDWAVGSDSLVGDDGMYSIRVVGTAAPATAVQIDAIRIGSTLSYREGIGQYGALNMSMDNEPLLLQGGEVVFPYFSTADAGNRLEIAYKVSP